MEERNMIEISIDELPDNVVIYRYIDNDFIFIDLNKNAQKLENVSKEFILGKKLIDVFPSVKEFGLYDLLLEVRKNAQPKELDMKFYKDDNISGWRHNSVRKLANGDIIVFYKDLGEYKILEEQTKRQKEQQEETERVLHTGSWRWDILTNEIIWSDEVFRIFGEEPQSFKPSYERFISYLDEQDQINLANAIQNSINGNIAYKFEHKVIKKDNAIAYVQESGNAQFNENGEAVSMIGSVLDITQKHEAQMALAQQYDLLQNIVNTVPIRIFWKDIDGVYRGANKLLLEDAQLDSLDELIGKTDFDMPWADTEAQSYKDDDLKVINSGIAKINFEETQTTDDGEQLTVLTSKVPLRDINGKVIGALGTYSDITKMRNMEDELERQKQQLIFQSRLAQMGEMISMIAHQWRQPLSTISIIASNLVITIELESFDLSTQAGQEEQKKYFLDKLMNIHKYVQSLTQTIDDFRNFYRANKKSVRTTLKEVITKALNIIEVSLKNDNIELIYNYNSTKEISLYDSEMMQVVLSILKNSQDAFQDKKIKNPIITIEINERSFSIDDNAGGISQDIIEKIFDPYFSTKNEKNGTGLGLYMSKLIVNDHHDGELSVINKNDGACFNIEIPLKTKE